MTEPPKPPSVVRLLTLNAHQGLGGRRRREALARIREGLRATDSDLVFLQEIGGDDVPDSSHQYEMLAEQVWPQFAYGRNAVAIGGHHGNALLSKYPISAWQNIDVSVGNAEPRGLLHCRLEVPILARPLDAICVHFGLRESHRRHQLGRLLAFVKTIESQNALIVAGDFNDWRTLGHRRLLADGGLAEIHSSDGALPARTFPARWPLLRLDRIYIRNLQYRPLQMPRRPWDALSDHIPLAGEVW